MTRDELIEKAARIAGLIDWNPTCLPGQEQVTIVRQILESAGSLGLLVNPEQHAMLSPEVSQTILRLGRDLAEARRERDLAIAHDRQPYPTAHAYEQVCRALRERTEERDALLPRLADLTEAAGKERSTEWIRLCATLPPEEWPPAPAYKGPMVPARDLETARWHSQMLTLSAQNKINQLTAERDALQARLDAALAVLDEPVLETPHGANALWKVQNHRAVQVQLLRAALEGEPDTRTASSGPAAQGIPDDSESTVDTPGAALQDDQPTEPTTRCMNGPAKQHTLRMVEIIKALKAAAVNGQLPATAEPLPFAKLARAIVDYWPTGEADRG